MQFNQLIFSFIYFCPLGGVGSGATVTFNLSRYEILIGSGICFVVTGSLRTNVDKMLIRYCYHLNIFDPTSS